MRLTHSSTWPALPVTLALAFALSQGSCAQLIGIREYRDAGPGGQGGQGGGQGDQGGQGGGQGGQGGQGCPDDPNLGVNAPVLIADNQAKPRALAVADGRYVFWANEGDQTLWKADLTTCAPPELVASTEPLLVRDLAVDETYVYWSASAATPAADCTQTLPSHVGRAPRNRAPSDPVPKGSDLDIRWTGTGCSGDPALSASPTYLYWTAPKEGNILQMLKTDQNLPRIIGGQAGVTSISGSDTVAYWSLPDSLAVQAVAAKVFKTPVAFLHFAADHPTTVIADAINIYVSDKEGEVYKFSQAGGEMNVPFLTSQQGLITSLAVDDTHVYFTVPGFHQVRRVLFTDPAPKTVTAADSAPTDPVRVAVDATRIYWTTNLGGKVYWMKKKP